MKYSNFNKKYILIFKLLLCLYILLSPYVKHDILLQIVNDDGIKILFILLILYFIEVDYTVSLLLSISLIIMIVLHNKDNIENIKNEFMNNIKNKNKIKENENKDINGTTEMENKIFEEEEDMNNIVITENYITDNSDENLQKIQTNIFNKKNDTIYFSGNYTNSLVTTQGELDIVN